MDSGQLIAEDKKQMTLDGRHKAEDRGQGTVGRGPRTVDTEHRTLLAPLPRSVYKFDGVFS